ncbi:hypothetical protein [Weizmannia phage Youna2]
MAIKGLDGVLGNLNRSMARRTAGLYALANGYAQELEAYAKAHAPWRDRTGNARQGLKGRASLEEADVVIRLIHQVDYGIYLEKARSGKYAILKPTINANKARIRAGLERYWRAT